MSKTFNPQLLSSINEINVSCSGKGHAPTVSNVNINI